MLKLQLFITQVYKTNSSLNLFSIKDIFTVKLLGLSLLQESLSNKINQGGYF